MSESGWGSDSDFKERLRGNPAPQYIVSRLPITLVFSTLLSRLGAMVVYSHCCTLLSKVHLTVELHSLAPGLPARRSHGISASRLRP